MLAFDLTQRPEIEHVLEGGRAPERSDLHRKISSRLRQAASCGRRVIVARASGTPQSRFVGLLLTCTL
ncbi:MAG TPA: hypothetical protein VKT83_17470 [bacterium]|nr:hypothetical protein [bacterium]